MNEATQISRIATKLKHTYILVQVHGGFFSEGEEQGGVLINGQGQLLPESLRHIVRVARSSSEEKKLNGGTAEPNSQEAGFPSSADYTVKINCDDASTILRPDR